MKAKPVKKRGGEYLPCSPDKASHVLLKCPGPFESRTIPVMINGTREGTMNWTWNGSVDKPTLRPSVLTIGTEDISDEDYLLIMLGEEIEIIDTRCHSWITDGKIKFLEDSNHELSGKTLDLLDVD